MTHSEMKYAAPEIVDYGSLTQLTAGGSFQDLVPASSKNYGGGGSKSGSSRGTGTGGISGCLAGSSSCSDT